MAWLKYVLVFGILAGGSFECRNGDDDDDDDNTTSVITDHQRMPVARAASSLLPSPIA
jgi:hypothetical protein